MSVATFVLALVLACSACTASQTFTINENVTFAFDVNNATIIANLTFRENSWASFGFHRGNKDHLVLCIATNGTASCAEYDGYNFKHDKDSHQRVKFLKKYVAATSDRVTIEFEVPLSVFAAVQVEQGETVSANFSGGAVSNGVPQPPTSSSSFTPFSLAIPAANATTVSPAPTNSTNATRVPATFAPNSTEPANVTAGPPTRAPSAAPLRSAVAPVVASLVAALLMSCV